ncbi:MAG TPA: hypothetical protein VFC39_22955 [Acidobacteriaceae bacterium]|nr:hypothetical protein [Acidobacteriaceae bacterium]
MRFKIAVAAVALLSAGIMHADTITVNLGTSNQNYTLVGTQGSNGFGTYLAQQGTCIAGSSLTTCILTGNYTGTTPGYDAGAYTLTTTYNTADGGLAATSTDAVSSPDGGNYFQFNPFAADVNMDLLLVQTGGGANAVPLVENGVFTADSYWIGGTAPVCSNLPAGTNCTQGDVGLTDGGTFGGPVTGGVTFDSNISSSVVSAVPEPEWLALGGLLPGAFLFARRRLLS